MITWITTVGWSPFAVINPIIEKIDRDLKILNNIKNKGGL